MELLKHSLLALHLIGFSLLMGGVVFAIYEKRNAITSLVLNGARLQFVSGVFLYGMAREDFRLWAASIKLIVALLIIGILEMYRKKTVTKRFLWYVLVLILLQLIVAVFALEKSK
jgi:hypothetical protein